VLSSHNERIRRQAAQRTNLLKFQAPPADPFTGAMFKLPDVATIEEIAYHPGMDIAIASIHDIQPELRRCLVPVGRADITVTTE
jgi:hypothetical protein